MLNTNKQYTSGFKTLVVLQKNSSNLPGSKQKLKEENANENSTLLS